MPVRAMYVTVLDFLGRGIADVHDAYFEVQPPGAFPLDLPEPRLAAGIRQASRAPAARGSRLAS